MVEPIIYFQQAEFDAWWAEQADGVARAKPGRSTREDQPTLLALLEEHGCPELREAIGLDSEEKSEVQRELLEDLWQVRFRQSEVAWRSAERPKSRSAEFQEVLVFSREDEDHARLSYGLVHQSQEEVRTGGMEFRFRYAWRGIEWLPLGWCIAEVSPSIDRGAVHPDES
jgi:hypothetical protein